ncbi:MAG: hypothetical protein DMF32_02675 [Verrucomicrobia bacterium]|nr:MAG: hypothetical protein DMF32_02675 [Verrucomicrobiota bacterium]
MKGPQAQSCGNLPTEALLARSCLRQTSRSYTDLRYFHVVNLDAWSVLAVIAVILINQEPQGVCEVSNFPLLQSFLVLSLGRQSGRQGSAQLRDETPEVWSEYRTWRAHV